MAGTVAVVTGGGSGLGRAVCLRLAKRGVAVSVCDIDDSAARTVAQACRLLGPEASAARVDLATSTGPDAAISTCVDRFGRIDILVNNAAYGAVEPFMEMTAGCWDTTLAVNVRAVALATSAAARWMRAQGGGRVVNITSPAARMAQPDSLAYAASKAAVDAVTRAAATALAPLGISVNSVSPGMMDTPLQDALEQRFAALSEQSDIAAFKAARTGRIPVGRRGDPDEIAAAVEWLCCDAGPYVTAARLNVSGGLDKD